MTDITPEEVAPFPVPPPAQRSRRRSPVHRRRRRREVGLAALMLLPSLVVFGVFVFYPLVKTAQLGFFRTPPFPGLPKRYVGFDQYRDVITSHDFLNSLKTTLLFAVFTVPIGIALGIAMATLAHQKLKGIRIFRTIFSSTVATSVAVASVIFFTLLNPQVGLFSYWLGRRGGTGILQDTTWALPAVSVATIWQNLGFTFILMSAALQSIPDELHEAAMVDGAGTWRRFRRVTLPLLSPTVFFAAVIGTISAFQAFGQIDLLTEGGPLNHTRVLTYYLYQSAFRFNNDGVAAVLAVALFGITLILTALQLRFVERRVFYAR
ncbi:MAG TPA: sugar ABC transporter permease [Acidimicrobiales bacterium]|nr:sugar ABC transporter permease [Acidimicrobiales bacterium]